MARPKGTTRRPTSPPSDSREAVVRALLGAPFPVDLGWRLYRIRALRDERDAIKSGRIPDSKSEVFTGESLEDGEPVASASRLETVKREFHEETEAFGLDCQLAAIHGNAKFLADAAKGIERFTSPSAGDSVTLAVADAWMWLTMSKDEFTRADITARANELCPHVIDSGKTRDALRRLGIND